MANYFYTMESRVFKPPREREFVQKNGKFENRSKIKVLDCAKIKDFWFKVIQKK